MLAAIFFLAGIFYLALDERDHPKY